MVVSDCLPLTGFWDLLSAILEIASAETGNRSLGPGFPYQAWSSIPGFVGITRVRPQSPWNPQKRLLL